MRKFKRAVTDCETAVKYDMINKKGISNLLTVYCAATGKTIAEAEAEFEGQGYGIFKPAVGEAVVELVRPIQEEAKKLLGDKAYLEASIKRARRRQAILPRRRCARSIKRSASSPAKESVSV